MLSFLLQGCIVNMDHIEEITGKDFHGQQGTCHCTQRGSNAIKKAYLEYLFHQIPINNHLTISIPDIPLYFCRYFYRQKILTLNTPSSVQKVTYPPLSVLPLSQMQSYPKPPCLSNKICLLFSGFHLYTYWKFLSTVFILNLCENLYIRIFFRRLIFYRIHSILQKISVNLT